MAWTKSSRRNVRDRELEQRRPQRLTLEAFKDTLRLRGGAIGHARFEEAKWPRATG
jgi:hypothetical protein